jgi:hypothetical protein
MLMTIIVDEGVFIDVSWRLWRSDGSGAEMGDGR